MQLYSCLWPEVFALDESPDWFQSRASLFLTEHALKKDSEWAATDFMGQIIPQCPCSLYAKKSLKLERAKEIMVSAPGDFGGDLRMRIDMEGNKACPQC